MSMRLGAAMNLRRLLASLIETAVLAITILLLTVVAFAHPGHAMASQNGGPLTRAYQWNSEEDRARYEGVQWDPISTARLEGFASYGAVIEQRLSPCGASGSPVGVLEGNALRTEGGLCPLWHWLEYAHDGAVERIDSPAHLQQAFAPVDSAAKAVSFVAAVAPDLSVDAADKLEGHVAQVEDGFLVEVVRKNTFGCGNHVPTGEIYRVTSSGDVQRIAAELQLPAGQSPVGTILCVD